MVRILALAASPTDMSTIRLGQEIRDIDLALQQAQFGYLFELTPFLAVRVSDVQSCLLRHRPEIVHFCSHGQKGGGLVLEDGEGRSQLVPVAALADLFKLLKEGLRCVVLNSCYSEGQAYEIAQHVDCVVGMSDAIQDTAAISFAVAFYRALAYGKDVKTAFDLGCNQIGIEDLSQDEIPQLIALSVAPEKVVFVSSDAPANCHVPDRTGEPLPKVPRDTERSPAEGARVGLSMVSERTELVYEALLADQYEHGEWGKCENEEGRGFAESHRKPNLFTSVMAADAIYRYMKCLTTEVNKCVSWVKRLIDENGWVRIESQATRIPPAKEGRLVRNYRHTAKAWEFIARRDALTILGAERFLELLTCSSQTGGWGVFPGDESEIWATCYMLDFISTVLAGDSARSMARPGESVGEVEKRLRDAYGSGLSWLLKQNESGFWHWRERNPLWVSTGVFFQAFVHIKAVRPEFIRFFTGVLLRAFEQGEWQLEETDDYDLTIRATYCLFLARGYVSPSAALLLSRALRFCRNVDMTCFAPDTYDLCALLEMLSTNYR